MMGFLPNALRTRTFAVDALVAVLLAVAMVAVTPHAGANQLPWRRQVDGAGYALLVAAAATLAFRRVAPAYALGAMSVVLAAYLGMRYPYGPILLVPVLGLYAAGSRLPPRRSVALAVGAIAVMVVGQAIAAGPQLDASYLVALVAWHGWLIVPWGVGAGIRSRAESGRHERDEAARRVAYEERLRIAREVHDVVGHGLAVINMQAGVALHVVDRRPEQARLALEAIKQTSKDALDELRAALDVFRQPQDDEARQPAPGLGQVDEVIAAMVDGGLPVDLVVTGEAVALPAAVDLAAYRIVQESLTNVARHAGPARATVRVRYEPRQVVLEIVNDGRTRASGNGRGGQGIAGMRERAAAVHGTLEAGPRPEGGFRVLAHLPSGGGRP
ncbi:MAG TPA: sensor histidine kinase [Candidatus Dormibacteraeota bacterium]